MENVTAGSETETIRVKRLGLEIKQLTPAQKDIYTNAIIQRREELLKEGERNVPIEEREVLLERVKSGEITAEDVKRVQIPTKQEKPSPRMGSVTLEQVEESRKRHFPSAEDGLTTGDRD